MTADDSLLKAAEVLEAAAIGDEGEARDRTLVRLMQHGSGAVVYAEAGQIALHALRSCYHQGAGVHAGLTGDREKLMTDAMARLRISLPTGRPWTPSQWDGTRGTIYVKRCCNGCGEPIGDVTDEEMAAAIDGRPLPDVRALCGCLTEWPASAVVGQ